jgi:hypothetical protein
MRKYSPVIGLLAVITAMVIFQIGEMDVHAASSTPSSQAIQMNRQSITGNYLMVPMDARLAKDAGGDKDADHDKKVGESEKKEDKPDLRTVDWYKTASAKEDDGNDEADEEGEGEDDEGGFDRLWDVVLNG